MAKQTLGLEPVNTPFSGSGHKSDTVKSPLLRGLLKKLVNGP